MKKTIFVISALFIVLSLVAYLFVAKPSVASSVERWEYHIESLEKYRHVKDAMPVISKLGSEGWEYVECVLVSGGEIVFKRKLR